MVINKLKGQKSYITPPILEKKTPTDMELIFIINQTDNQTVLSF